MSPYLIGTVSVPPSTTETLYENAAVINLAGVAIERATDREVQYSLLVDPLFFFAGSFTLAAEDDFEDGGTVSGGATNTHTHAINGEGRPENRSGLRESPQTLAQSRPDLLGGPCSPCSGSALL